jgi:hypothetical protein
MVKKYVDVAGASRLAFGAHVHLLLLQASESEVRGSEGTSQRAGTVDGTVLALRGSGS